MIGGGGDAKLDLAWMEGRLDRSTTFEGHVRTQIAEVRPGHASLFIEIEPFHLNGNGTLHGGVYATLIDNAMGFAVAALARVRIATTQMNVHFLGPISSGRITCTADVVHRTRRTATAEAKVRDADGNLLAMGTGAFRIFEQQGHPIV
jgi:uncharacterized protein (TIGR00369 family)